MNLQKDSSNLTWHFNSVQKMRVAISKTNQKVPDHIENGLSLLSKFKPSFKTCFSKFCEIVSFQVIAPKMNFPNPQIKKKIMQDIIYEIMGSYNKQFCGYSD